MSAVIGGALVAVLAALDHRYLLGEGFEWGRSVGTGAGPAGFWLVLGALHRSGWWDRQEARRRVRQRTEDRLRERPWSDEQHPSEP